MTRRDWWLGIILVVAVLVLNAILTVSESMKTRSAIEAMLTPKPRPLTLVTPPPPKLPAGPLWRQ